jgi:hypothetical protein
MEKIRKTPVKETFLSYPYLKEGGEEGKDMEKRVKFSTRLGVILVCMVLAIPASASILKKEPNITPQTIANDINIKKENTILDNLTLCGDTITNDINLDFVNCHGRNAEYHADITGRWTHNITFNWTGGQGLHLRIFDNPIITGSINVRIQNVYTLSEGIIIEIYDNGENIKDPTKNQAVGNINVLFQNNVCMPCAITVTHNWVHYNITMDIRPSNAVNTCLLALLNNHVGQNITLLFNQNAVDSVFIVNIEDNTIGEILTIDLSGNPHFGWVEYQTPCTITINITGNHCVRKGVTNTIFINGNIHFGVQFYTTIHDNGFGGDLSASVSGNINIGGVGDMKNWFLANRCDMLMTLVVQHNQGYAVKDYMVDNAAADAFPTLQPQNPVDIHGNTLTNQQMVGTDSDGDGLTDDYETMIGTDPENNDTDQDGILDGWNDVNGNAFWDAGSGWRYPPEQFGEVGDPLQEVETTKHKGSDATTFAGDNDLPNPINKDIYLEIDFLEGCTAGPDIIKPLQEAFARHCIWLHIDMGWQPGSAGGSTGGDIIPGGFTHNARNYVFFSDVFPRRLVFPFPIMKNDFYDFKIKWSSLKPSPYFNGGYQGAREDIFHYILFVHYYATRTQDNLTILYRDNAAGRGELGRVTERGDDFLVCYDNHVSGGVLNVSSLQDTVMHELGHNLELLHSWQGGTPPAGNDPDPAVNPWPPNETVFTTVMYWEGWNKLDYLREEWARIDLTAVRDGVRLFYS